MNLHHIIVYNDDYLHFKDEESSPWQLKEHFLRFQTSHGVVWTSILVSEFILQSSSHDLEPAR